MYGYHGRVMLVDLGSKSVRWEPLDEDILRHFIGGTGLGAYLLYRYGVPRCDPLSPENPLIFATSPLVGSRLTTSSKFAVVAKSPLTGMIGDSLSSSFIATELKKTGSDAIVIMGRSTSPTLLAITDEDVEFRDASHLMGMGTSATERAVKAQLGGMYRVACIGPAGENLVRFAGIANDGGRQAGRTGPGAVMGSKNLKAIAVRGHSTVSFAEPEALNDITGGPEQAQPRRCHGEVPHAGHHGERVGVQPAGSASDEELSAIDLRGSRDGQRGGVSEVSPR